MTNLLIKSWSLLHLFFIWMFVHNAYVSFVWDLFINEWICLTGSILRVVLHLSVVCAGPLVETRVRGRAAVAQRAAPAAHRGVRRVKVFRTLNALMVISTAVQPAVAVLSLGIRYPQIPCQIPQDQAIQQAHHTGEMRLNSVPLKQSAPDKLPVFGLSER